MRTEADPDIGTAEGLWLPAHPLPSRSDRPLNASAGTLFDPDADQHVLYTCGAVPSLPVRQDLTQDFDLACTGSFRMGGVHTVQ